MTFSVLMRQGMDEVSNTFFFFYKSLPVHAVDGLVMIYHPGNVFFIFFFLHFHVDLPPLCHWDPSFDHHCLAGWKIFNSLPRSQIYDYYFFGMWWHWRLWNSLNNTEYLKAPLAARWRPCCSWHPTGPKWFEQSDCHFHPQSPQCSQLKV